MSLLLLSIKKSIDFIDLFMMKVLPLLISLMHSAK